jgi:hypothetical protein
VKSTSRIQTRKVFIAVCPFDYGVGMVTPRGSRWQGSRKVKIFIRNQRTLNDQMQESWSVGLTQVFVDAAGDVDQHSFRRQGMSLAAMLPGEIQQGGVF